MKKWWPLVFSETDKTVIGYTPAKEDSENYLEDSVVFGLDKNKLLEEATELVKLGAVCILSLKERSGT